MVSARLGQAPVCSEPVSKLSSKNNGICCKQVKANTQAGSESPGLSTSVPSPDFTLEMAHLLPGK